MRGNGKIIQELEAIFRGAGWNVIKVIWGGDWDPLIQADRDGLLVRRMGEITRRRVSEILCGERRLISAQNFFGTDPRLLKMVEHLSDEQLAACGSADTIRSRFMRRTELRSSTRGRRRSFWRRRSKATGWAKQAKARTSRTSRRS